MKRKTKPKSLVVHLHLLYCLRGVAGLKFQKLVQSKTLVEVYCMKTYFDCMNAQILRCEEVWNYSLTKNLHENKELHESLSEV